MLVFWRVYVPVIIHTSPFKEHKSYLIFLHEKIIQSEGHEEKQQNMTTEELQQ